MEPDNRTWDELVEQSHHRGERAARRAAEARERGEEIDSARRAFTSSGEAAALSTPQTVARAPDLADESRERSAGTHLDAARAHDLAERASRRAAVTDPAHAAEHQEHARRHHDEAAQARRDADADRQAR
ncbi:hypothetical protein AB0G04_18065 [Actinoplanes sp. NPDC023801]|uniref:hypothetical protein n=1 Tax=Actinoplanes sp. NPDC023801 TaxID=3154595 RepID=UPI0033FB3C7D